MSKAASGLARLNWVPSLPEWADEALVAVVHLILFECRRDSKYATAIELLQRLDSGGYSIVKAPPSSHHDVEN